MKIDIQKVLVRDLVDQYEDREEEGVVGYHGKLDIRPPYQREFVYKPKQRDAVIRSVRARFPINVMYWSKDSSNDTYEVLDGQQRTISLCEFVENGFPVDDKYFHNLTPDEQEKILNYELHVYVCEGKESDKLAWFEIINTAPEKLTDQELRNAVYSGPWLASAKAYFSKPNCPASDIGKHLVKGSAIRQELLELAIEWINEGDVRGYMAKHQHDETALPLWEHYEKVINWATNLFPNLVGKYKEMKSVDWGPLYKHCQDKGKTFNPKALESRVKELMKNKDVESKSGIYAYLLTGEEKHLNLRQFDDNEKREAYENQDGVCPKCSQQFAIEDMEGDHIDPWHSGGKTTAENCQMLCKPCNRRKSGK